MPPAEKPTPPRRTVAGMDELVAHGHPDRARRPRRPAGEPSRAARAAAASPRRQSGMGDDALPSGGRLLFHCLTSHAALPNRCNWLRVSGDFRWQPIEGAGARRARPRAGAAPVRAVLSSLPAPAVVGAGAGVSHDRPAQRTSRCSPGSVPLLSRPSRLVDLATATTGGPLTGHRLRSNRGHTSEASLHPLLRGLERATPPSRRRPRRPDPESSRGASLDRAPACFSRRHTHRHRRSRPARRLRIGRCDYAAGTVTGSWLAPPGAADVAKSFWRMRNPQPMAATKASTAPIASTSFKPLTRP